METMSLLPDSTLTHAVCTGKAKGDTKPAANGSVKQGYSRLRSISVPSLSSVVRDSLMWAGDTLYPRRDAKWRKMKEEQKDTLSAGELRQVAYYDMENVGFFKIILLILFGWTKLMVAGSNVRGVGGECPRARSFGRK